MPVKLNISSHKWLTHLPGALMLALCAVQSWHVLRGGDDVWAHAAIGRWIWQHGTVPHETLFVWGRAPLEWVYHSWLFQLAFYGLLETFGPPGVVLCTTLLSCLPFALLWLAWKRHSALEAGDFAPLIFALAIWCSTPRFRPRPELFTALFLTLLLIFLIAWNRQPAQQSMWRALRHNALRVLCVAAMFIVWANLHGAVTLGLALLFVTALLDGLQDKGSGRARALLLVALLAATVIWINPYGLEYFRALKPVGGAMFSAIDEWKPFWKHPALGYEYVVAEAVLVMLALAAWWSTPERRWSHAAWVVLMALAFVGARRHLWLLAIVCLAVMAAAAPHWSAERFGKAVWRGAGGEGHALHFLLHLLPSILLAIFIGATIKYQTWPPSVTSSQLPVQAAHFLQSQNIRGRLFSDYENSSYLQWRLTGQPPLYIDLLNAYPDDLMTDYLQIARAEARGRRLLDKLKINWVILRPRRANEGIARLAEYLNQNQNWRRVYQGRDATIWKRQGAR